jgi:single-strand DNA-binding protein
MASFNKVILMGNLTRDPELRYTPKGTAVAKLGLAVNRSWRNADGQQQDETTFVDVDAFGKQAETLGQYMQKGRPILIEGRLKLDQWEDKNTGQNRSKLGVTLEKFSFVGGGGGQAGGSTNAPQSSAPPPTSDVPPFEDGPSDDDVPF